MMDVALKQRMVGASVIIALAVIFIPMIFSDSLTMKSQTISIKIPDEPENLKHKVISLDSSQSNSDPNGQSSSDNSTKSSSEIDNQSLPIIKQETIIDVVDNSENNTSTRTVDPKNDENSTQESEQKNPINEEKPQAVDVITENNPENKGSTEIVNKENTNNVDSSTISTNTYRLKFGAFSQQNNAQKLKAQIIHSGFNAVVEKDLNQNLYKVFSPQMATRQEALVVSEKIQKLKLNIGKINIEKLDESMSNAAEMLLDTGWIVQMGSFSGKENALKLRDKIRDKGFVTFVDELENSKKQKRYRVRVGPFATRDESIEEQKNVLQKMNLKGLIKPHEKYKVIDK